MGHVDGRVQSGNQQAYERLLPEVMKYLKNLSSLSRGGEGLPRRNFAGGFAKYSSGSSRLSAGAAF